ncbi:MAG: DUF4438 domain-containing protein [Clostridiales bacterium]|nr:DUF4438 domain-containing protein [Clostridiales bacterium]
MDARIANRDRLVMQGVMGQIKHPMMKELPFRIDCDGVGHIIPNTAAITYNVKIGDSVYGWECDHVEPGVSITNPNSKKENDSLNMLSCVGNVATVVTGDAKGEKGFVTGTHGGVEHLLIYFPQSTIEKLTYDDKILVRAFGQGMKIEGFEKSVYALNLDPAVFDRMGIKAENGKLIVPVAGKVPAYLMGSGYGEASSEHGDYDIMTQDWEEIKRCKLDHLRFGDFVLLENCDNAYGRGYLTGARTIGVVVHSDCIRKGHGPGVTALLTSRTPVIEGVISEHANLADIMGV